MVDYLVENVNAGHAGDLLVYRCYETITVYRMTWVFVGGLWRRHAGGVAVVFGVNVSAVALDFSWTVC